MKAAIVRAAGQTPVYADFADPTPNPGENRVSVTTAALSPLVRGRAAGTHYSATAQFPFVVGVDGVGRLDDGTRVYFILPRAPYGSMAEQTVVGAGQCIPLPDDVDDVTAAAIANPGMSCWAGLTERAHLQPGDTVLINGATGTAGRLAIQVARYLGAKKVIATGRNPAVLAALSDLGADVTIPLVDDLDVLTKTFEAQFAERIDVVLDYLWGKSAERLLTAAARTGAEGKPIRFVQVGAISGGEITLPASLLRSAPIELLGSGLGSTPANRLFHAIHSLLHATIPGGFQIAAQPIPLAEVETAWTRDDSAARIVFTP